MGRAALVLGVLVSLAAGQSPGGRDRKLDPPTAEEINRAIDAGVAWLKESQRDGGSWGAVIGGGTYAGMPGPIVGAETGPTSFALFTLASCGVTKSDRTVKKGLKWLRVQKRDVARYSSYESASIVLMLTALNKAKGRVKRGKSPFTRPAGSKFARDDWRWMNEHLMHLVQCQRKTGGFGYYWMEEAYQDVSATQFAVLALRAASLAGYPVEFVAGGSWKEAAGYLEGLQDPKGGFAYHAGESWSAGMTAAALSSLLICREQMALRGTEIPTPMDKAIERAFARLGSEFDVATNRSSERRGGPYHYCHLYAVERVGMLSGRRVLGKKDWYLRGARWLLGEQKKDGKWVDRTCIRPEDVLGTCFALLFLKKATVPTVTPSD